MFPNCFFFVLSARIRGQPAGGKPLTTTTLSEGGALRRISLYRLCLQESRLREARPEDSIIVKDIYVLEPLINTTPQQWASTTPKVKDFIISHFTLSDPLINMTSPL